MYQNIDSMTKRYTEEQVDYVKRLVEKGEKVTPATRRMCKKFNIDFDDTVGRAFRKKMQKMGVTKNVRVIEDTKTFQKARKKKFDKRRKKFLITWAQNATPVHKDFFDNLEAYAEFHKAGLHVIAGRYKNPTSVFTDVKHEEWDDEVEVYLDAARHNIHEYVEVLSDIKISPTASTPLSGLDGVSGLETCIVGHPRQHLKSLPVLDGYPNKLLVSTGACTVDNYTDSKAGKKGEFHHSLGAVIVELDGEDFHIRHISADKYGNFYDLFYKVEEGVITNNDKGAEFAVLGDLHLQYEDKEAVDSALTLLDILKPEHTMVHDIFNGHSISHHERRNPFILMQRELDGSWSLDEEIQYMLNWLEKNKHRNLVIVRGNHEDHLDQWLVSSDWRKDSNKYQYFKYGSILAENKAPKGIIPYIIDKTFNGEIKTLGLDESYRVLGWELSLHGHIGSAGSRGSHTQFKRLNTKTVTAHGHHPHKEDGHVSVGTLTKLRMGYNKGLSNWMHGVVVGYPNGKTQIINIINGKYTTFK